MKSKDCNMKGTYEQKSQEWVDYIADLGMMLAPLLKLAFIAGMVYMNVQAGLALSHGGWIFPVMCGALDLALFWFWNKARSVELDKSEQWCCQGWALYLLFLSLLSGFMYACSLDAQNRVITNPVVAELKSQLEAATDLFEGMEAGTAERAFGGDPIIILREQYLEAYKKSAHDLGYAYIHAAFYVVPGVKNNPEFFMGIVRLLFVFAFVGSGLGLARFGAGVGRAERLRVNRSHGQLVPQESIVEGEYVPA